MPGILVFVESDAGSVSKSTLPVIKAAMLAKEIQGYTSVVAVVIAGEQGSLACEQISTLGLDNILLIEDSALSKYTASNYALALKEACAKVAPELILAPASTQGRDCMPRLAAMLDAAQASDVIEFLPSKKYKRPMYAGNILATVSLATTVHLATVRTSAFDQPTSQAGSSPIEKLGFSSTADARVKFVSFDTVVSERPELGEAQVIISGGRALKSSENFEKILFPLADALGAAVGASRAAVDSGYAPNDWQVGQTGKIVAPNLYIAIGISGAVQHLAGMKDSKVIVAINKDPEAPIFEVADYGLIADLFEAVPALTGALKS